MKFCKKHGNFPSRHGLGVVITLLPHLVVRRAKEENIGFGGKDDASMAETTFKVYCGST